MTKRHIDTADRVYSREHSPIRYCIKYWIPSEIRRIFSSDQAEELLGIAFDYFYKKWRGNITEWDREDFRTEEEYQEALDTMREIKLLLGYWEYRDNTNYDRILDDQMFIRLVKIRHKLKYN